MNAVKKLIAAYDEYIRLLEKAEEELFGLAYSHGYRTRPALIKRGADLRAKIKQLKLSAKTTR